MNSTVREITQPGLAAVASWARHLAAIAKGEHRALASFYDESAGFSYSLALRMLGDGELAEAATLAAYREVWRTAASFDATRQRADVWLSGLVRRQVGARLPACAAAGETALELAFFRGLKIAEIAARLGHSEQMVRQQIVAGMMAMRRAKAGGQRA